MLTAILNGYFFDWLNSKYFCFSTDYNGIEDFSEKVKFISVVLVSPLVETYFFQHLPNSLLIKLNIDSRIGRVFLLSLVFSIIHIYSWFYMLMVFLGGVILNFFYIEALRFSNKGFWWTALFHAFYNFYGYVFVM